MRRIPTLLVATVLVFSVVLSAAAASSAGSVVVVDTVEELYAAVSVPGAIVRVSAGTYVLDPALDPTSPHDGRLDLADRVKLSGPARLSSGRHRLPDASAAAAPIWNGDPAVIDGSNLPPDTFGLGVVVVGHRASVRDLWIRGSVDPSDPSTGFLGRPGLEIPSWGTVVGNVVEGATIGIRVRSDSNQNVRGTVIGNFVMDSGLMGVVAIPVPTTDGEWTSGSTITAVFRANRILRSGFNGILVVGGLSGDDNSVTVNTSDNVIQYAGLGMYVEVRGGGGLAPDPSDIRGASRNRIVLRSTRDSFDSVDVAYLFEGAIREYLGDPGGGRPLFGEESNDNSTVATIRGATIRNVFVDIIANAAATAVFPPPADAPVSGSNNTVTLTLRGIEGSGAPFNVDAADSVPPAPGSGNDVVIVGSRSLNAKVNSGLDFTAVADSDFSR